jgi:Transmembrane family 220, helix
MKRFYGVANGAMALLFAASAAVQYNDPDPVQWIAIYGAAAAVCVAALRQPVRAAFPAAIAIVALVWALSLAPVVIGMSAADIFQLHSGAGEEGREMYGLLIVTTWMTVLAFTARGRRGA